MEHREARKLHQKMLDQIWRSGANTQLWPFRSYEMAYLTSSGLNKAGFNSEMVIGTYFSQPHAWVTLDNYILDIHLYNTAGGKVSNYDDIVVWSEIDKMNYHKKDVIIQLADGIEEFAKKHI